MANLAAPSSEALTSYKAYKENGLLDLPLVFNIPIYNKLNYYNNNNNILSNQDRIYQRPISANINYYHLNKLSLQDNISLL